MRDIRRFGRFDRVDFEADLLPSRARHEKHALHAVEGACQRCSVVQVADDHIVDTASPEPIDGFGASDHRPHRTTACCERGRGSAADLARPADDECLHDAQSCGSSVGPWPSRRFVARHAGLASVVISRSESSSHARWERPPI